MRHCFSRPRASFLFPALIAAACGGGQTYDDGSDGLSRVKSKDSTPEGDASTRAGAPSVEDRDAGGDPDKSPGAGAAGAPTGEAGSGPEQAGIEERPDAGELPLDCRTRTDAINGETQALLAAASLSCEQDADCAAIDIPSPCSFSCGGRIAVSAEQAEALSSELESSTEDACDDFTAAGCEPVPLPCPAPPMGLEPSCVLGQCSLSQPDVSTGCDQLQVQGAQELAAAVSEISTACTTDDDCTTRLTPGISCLGSGCAETIGLNVSSADALVLSLEAIEAGTCAESAAQSCEVAVPAIECFFDETLYDARCVDQTCTPVALPAEASCAPLDVNQEGEWLGVWSGTLQMTQVMPGGQKTQDVEVSLEFREYGLPYGQLPALGYAGNDWHAYASPGTADGLSLLPLFEGGGVGPAWAYNSGEADGGANALAFESSCAEFQETSVYWAYEATFAWTDLVDYELYGYARDGAPVVAMAASEFYRFSTTPEPHLVVEAHSKGMGEAGEYRFSMTGTLFPAP